MSREDLLTELKKYTPDSLLDILTSKLDNPSFSQFKTLYILGEYWEGYFTIDQNSSGSHNTTDWDKFFTFYNQTGVNTNPSPFTPPESTKQPVGVNSRKIYKTKKTTPVPRKGTTKEPTKETTKRKLDEESISGTNIKKTDIKNENTPTSAFDNLEGVNDWTEFKATVEDSQIIDNSDKDDDTPNNSDGK